MLERLERAYAPDQRADVNINLKKCGYLGPDAVACLAAYILEAEGRGLKTTVVWPEGPKQLRTYCDVSGLKMLVEADQYSNEEFDRTQNVLRLRKFTTAQFNDADPVVSLLKAHIAISSNLEEYLRLCVLEIIQNIYDHSESPVGGLITARYMSKRPEVRIAVVDRGAGICTTLRRRFSDTTPHNALRRVVKGEYSALSRQNNAGLGISMLVQWVTLLGGDVAIISESSWTHAKDTNRYFETTSFRFGGTGVFLTIPASPVDEIL